MTRTILMQPLRITDRSYAQHLERATDTIFDYATYVLDWDWARLAAEAKLNYNTVNRLGSRLTKLPREQTFWKLASACGLVRQFVDAKGQIILPFNPKLKQQRG